MLPCLLLSGTLTSCPWPVLSFRRSVFLSWTRFINYGPATESIFKSPSAQMIRSIGTIGNQIFQSLVSEHIPPIHFLSQWLHCSDYVTNLGNSCNYLTQFWYRTVYEESAQPVAIWCRPLPLPWNVDRMSTTWPSCSILLLLQKWGHGNCWLQHELSEYRKRHLNTSLRFFRNKGKSES